MSLLVAAGQKIPQRMTESKAVQIGYIQVSSDMWVFTQAMDACYLSIFTADMWYQTHLLTVGK